MIRWDVSSVHSQRKSESSSETANPCPRRWRNVVLCSALLLAECRGTEEAYNY